MNYEPGSASQLSNLTAPTAAPEPGGFWIRFVAVMIDGFIAVLLILPIQAAFQMLFQGMFKPGETPQVSMGQGLVLAGLYIVMMVGHFLYYAWFNRNKGGTPGKLLFGLRIVDLRTGSNISYGTTALRQWIGMIANVLTLYVGFLMAGFRKDKRGLHDIIAGTQVIRVRR